MPKYVTKFTDVTPDQVRNGIKAVLPMAVKKRLRNNDDGLSLEIDDNFRLFFHAQPVPCDGPLTDFAVRWELLQKPYNKTLHRGAEPAVGDNVEAAVRTVVKDVGSYLSTAGQMRTYASITLKTMTGIGPFTV